MRLDAANRSFLGLLAVGYLVYLFVGMAACVLLATLAVRISTDGLDATASGLQLAAAMLFLAPVGAGALLGLWSLWQQAQSSRRLAERVRALTIAAPPELAEAARRTRLDGRLRLVDADEAFSFAYGAVSPTVAVSRGLVEAVSPAELEAVLEHERYHIVNLDPLKVVLARALLRALFYLPALRALEDRYLAGRELAADARAIDRRGRRPLAGALLKVIRGPGWPELATAAAIGGPELLAARVAQLEGADVPAAGAIPRVAAVLSGLSLVLLAAALAAAMAATGGPAAITRTAMPDTELSAGDAALGLACVLPWIAAAFAGYRWLAWRAGRTRRA
jgi:hypothetical protein